MFELSTKGSEGWKAIVGLSKSLNDEAVINVTNEGLDFKVMDQDRSGLIDFIWKKENMIDFKCESEQKIGFRTEDFSKFLKRAGNDDIINIKQTNNATLIIKIGDTKFYEMRLIETDLIETGSRPKVVYDNKITVPYTALKEKVDDMVIIGDYMQIKVNNGQIDFKVTGDSSSGTTLYKDESIKVKEEISGEYSISHLDNALKSVKTNEISLGIQNNYPLCLELIMPDVGEIKYYLAPHLKR